jgi:hypothetical protein
MEKKTSTLSGFVAGMRAGVVAFATIASLHLGGGTAAAAPQTWTTDPLTVPLCVDPGKVGGAQWGQVGTLTAQGDGTTIATSFKVEFNTTNVKVQKGSTSLILYATLKSDPNARHDIGSGTLITNHKTGLVGGTIQLYGTLSLAEVDLENDTFRLEGTGLTPPQGILDCIG